MVKTCIVCDKKFETPWESRKLCSGECRAKRAAEINASYLERAAQGQRICPACGQEFTLCADEGARGPKRRLCDACRVARNIEANKAYRQRKREKLGANRREQEQAHTEEQLRKIKKSSPQALNDIATAAKAEGLSYGKYVAKHGL